MTKKHGFTIAEVVVSMALLAIISTSAFTISNNTIKAKESSIVKIYAVNEVNNLLQCYNCYKLNDATSKDFNYYANFYLTGTVTETVTETEFTYDYHFNYTTTAEDIVYKIEIDLTYTFSATVYHTDDSEVLYEYSL